MGHVAKHVASLAEYSKHLIPVRTDVISFDVWVPEIRRTY